ncbi:phage head spike fiber domain-containing protein, partial [Lactococcus lactis]
SLAETAKALGQNALDQFNALSVGGRNILRNSAFFADSGKLPEYWTTKGGGTALAEVVDVTDLIQVKKALHYVSSKTSSDSTGMRSTSAYENIKPGTTYTGSIWMRNNTDTPLIARPSAAFRDSTGAVLKTITQYKTLSKAEGWVRIVFSGEAPENTTSIYFYSYVSAVSNGADGYLEQDFLVAAPKFEEGTIPTDWTLAPEDTQVKIEQLENGLKTTVSQSQYNANQTAIDSRISSVTQTANSVNSIVTNLTNGMPTGSSIISQISDSVSILVQKNDVINQINVSTEGILIAGS